MLIYRFKINIMSYQIKINVFEGPYDLLLFLIKKGEIDIYDIPIAKISKEYLEYIAIMRSLDLEIAGEFIVMAATLMRIKAKMLLPVHVEEEEEIEDPRRELVRNLLEYQRIKDAAGQFERLEFRSAIHFPRGNPAKNGIVESQDDYFDMQASIYELVVAYNAVLKKRVEEKYHYVQPDPATIEEKMEEILRLLDAQKRISFHQHLMSCSDRIIIVINFLAILELAKRGQIRISQSQPFRNIWIYKHI